MLRFWQLHAIREEFFNTLLMDRARIWIVGFCTLVAAINLGGCRRLYEQATGVERSRSQSTEVAEITLSSGTGPGLDLHVPQAYLVSARNRRGGVQSVVNIETQLPGLSAAPALPYNDLAALRNGLAIRLYARPVDIRHAVEALENDYNNVNRTIGDSRKFEERESEVPDLRRYRELSCWPTNADGTVANTRSTGYERCQDSMKDHYLAVDMERYPRLRILCSIADQGKTNLSIGCDASTAFRGYTMGYIFRRSELPRWQEFDAGTRTLLERFALSK